MKEEIFLEYNVEDDDEWGEYDEEAELDMMFPNREDDDSDDYSRRRLLFELRFPVLFFL